MMYHELHKNTSKRVFANWCGKMKKFLRKFTMTLSGLCLLTTAAYGDVTSEDEAGTVVRLEGVALAIQDALPRVLKPGEKIYIGDILSTGKEARLEVKINDGTIFNLGERSSFNVIDFTYFTGEDASISKGVFRLLQGAVNGATGKLASLGGIDIKGDAATIGIRGTAFWVGDMPDGSLGVVHWKGGGLDVSNDKGSVQFDGNGEGSEIKEGAPKTWARWKQNYARWSVDFDAGPRPYVPDHAK
ncbi:MAG: hypothetical protein CMM59_23795 [Rhodospirillaceae bacterium]|nr:hypothetical protein [Rhodospirillaceae bacterium]